MATWVSEPSPIFPGLTECRAGRRGHLRRRRRGTAAWRRGSPSGPPGRPAACTTAGRPGSRGCRGPRATCPGSGLAAGPRRGRRRPGRPPGSARGSSSGRSRRGRRRRPCPPGRSAPPRSPPASACAGPAPRTSSSPPPRGASPRPPGPPRGPGRPGPRRPGPGRPPAAGSCRWCSPKAESAAGRDGPTPRLASRRPRKLRPQGTGQPANYCAPAAASTSWTGGTACTRPAGSRPSGTN
mmetsp:Transcript_113848/g.332634  ORF Transcript_113848/g.332634 Transcript_113848/m.332634 type:complete len:239 (-) Transcript_113848:1324-2040(-)